MSQAGDKYRQRSTGEIEKEQHELELLRAMAEAEKSAWWQFSAMGNNFQVSPEWRELTGYQTGDVFPMDVSPDVHIENLLPNLIDRLMDLVSDRTGKKKTVRRKINEFLLFKRESNSFEYAYPMLRKDGSEVYVLTVAKSVWADGRLKLLFVQSRDIGKYKDSDVAAAEIAKQKQHQKVTTIKLNELIESFNGLLVQLAKTAPIIGALLATVAGFGGQALTSAANFFKLAWADPSVQIADTYANDSLLLSRLTEKQIKRLEDALKLAIVDSAEYARIGIYSPSYTVTPYPDTVRIFLQAADNGEQHIDIGAHRVTESDRIAARSLSHVSKSPHTHSDGQTLVISIPFSIDDEGGLSRLLFAEVETRNKVVGDDQKLQATAARLSLSVGKILSK